MAGVEAGNAFAGNWSVDASVICVDPLAGEQRVTVDSADNSTASRAVTATCPAGKRLHGVGGKIVGGEGQVRLTEMRPTSSTTATVRATEDENGFSGNWKVRAYAGLRDLSGQPSRRPPPTGPATRADESARVRGAACRHPCHRAGPGQRGRGSV